MVKVNTRSETFLKNLTMQAQKKIWIPMDDFSIMAVKVELDNTFHHMPFLGGIKILRPVYKQTSFSRILPGRYKDNSGFPQMT